MTDRRGKKIKRAIGLGLFLGSIAFIPQMGMAEIYQFVDQHGTLHFSNVPTNRHFQPVLVTRPPALSYNQLKNTIHKTGSQYRVDPHLIRAVIKVNRAGGKSFALPRTTTQLPGLWTRRVSISCW